MPNVADIYFFNNQKEISNLPPVVLIHGAGGTHLHWPAEIRRLTEYRVFALDLPGHGKSGGRGLQTIEAYAQSVLEWLEAMGIFRAVFVGHSMGGAIALTIARENPERVIALGLIATGARLRVAPDLLENSMNSATFPVVLDTITSWAFSEEADPRLISLASKRMSEIRPSVFRGDFLACDAFNLLDTVSDIRIPSLVLCGQDDKLTPVRFSQYLADNIRGAQLVIIPKAGHMVMLEHPQSVTSALTEFLGKLPF
jgi:pimeloyl-ACP methyl ester carboxylesterase